MLGKKHRMKHGEIPDKPSKGTVSVSARLFIFDKIQPHAVLATESNGQPYTSLVAYALTPDAKGLIFITPKTTRKYKNILRNKQVSLLLDTRTNTPEDYMVAESITILGKAQLLRKSEKWMRLASIFTKKHKKLKKIVASPETALILVEITTCIHVTQFQSVTIWEVS
jgi:nitroimidazol reductase NimA-like FMN-containing flavoprotein (pyridoxamine 5'-phosphate oxidase superfamily)